MNQRDSKYLWKTGTRSSKNILMWISVSKYDHASRGIIGNKRHKIDQWFHGSSFFGKTQMNGLLQQKFQKLTTIMILKSKG